jgi:LysR family transcriptional regulator, hydrogen peroxide-inducible genes activator
MEMHQIRYFLAAAKHLNFTKAAQECNVSGPSLIRAIKLLELEFGGPLFNRERSRTHLTELGRIALPHLEQVLQESLDAKRKARDFLNLKEATLKLGIMCTVAPSQFVELVTGFRERYTNVILRIIDANARQLQTALLAGDLEAAIYCLPGEPPHERTHVMPLFKEQMVIAVCRSHALAMKKVIKGEHLKDEAYLDRINCEFTGYADRIFADRQIDGPTVYQSERDDWLLAMVAAGMGYSFLPRSSADYAGVVVRPIAEPEFWRTVNLVTVRGRRHSPTVGALVREVMQTRWQGRAALAVQAVARPKTAGT